jgi:hypothetical protein
MSCKQELHRSINQIIMLKLNRTKIRRERLLLEKEVKKLSKKKRNEYL